MRKPDAQDTTGQDTVTEDTAIQVGAPVFLLSLPRSGSTMLQRALGAHPHCATVSEPWVLLGMLPPDADADAAVSTVGEAPRRQATEDLISLLPDGVATWNAALGGAARALYATLARAQGGARYFLDKTPRYALAPHAVRDMFPEAPILILWRNPLSIAASMMSTYSAGRWNLDRFVQDLEIALPRLVAFAHSHPEGVLALRYETLTAGGNVDLAEVLAFLNLAPADTDDAGAETIDAAENVVLTGRMGDPTGGLNTRVQTHGDARWKAQFRNPLRRAWARRYLRRLGAERLAVMGYDLETLLADVADCEGMFGHLGSDLILMPRGVLRRLFATRVVVGQWARLLRGTPVVDLE